MKKTLLAIAALIAISTSAQADPFELKGIKMGMSIEQAREQVNSIGGAFNPKWVQAMVPKAANGDEMSPVGLPMLGKEKIAQFNFGQNNRLNSISLSTYEGEDLSLYLSAFDTKYGKGIRSTEQFKTKGGGTFDNLIVRWELDDAVILFTQHDFQLGTGSIFISSKEGTQKFVKEQSEAIKKAAKDL